MQTLLHINSSLSTHAGNSSQLAQSYVAKWRHSHHDGQVISRDLAASPTPHLDKLTFDAFAKDAADRDRAERAAVARSDTIGRRTQASRRPRFRFADVQLRCSIDAEGIF